MSVGSTLAEIMAVRNSLWRRKYGENECKNECSLSETPSLYQSYICIAVVLSRGHGSAKGRELEQGKVKVRRGHMKTGWTSLLES